MNGVSVLFLFWEKLTRTPRRQKGESHVCFEVVPFHIHAAGRSACSLPQKRGRVNGPVSGVGVSTEILPLETLGGVVRVELVFGVFFPAGNVVFFFGLGISFFVF